MKGRILALDYGEKRIGVALSDPLRMLAGAREVFVRGPDLEADLARLATFARGEEVVDVVIGFPENVDGTRGEMVRKVEDFAARLSTHLPVPIHFVDESYTSLAADEELRARHRDPKKRKALRDSVAARLILESFMRSPP